MISLHALINIEKEDKAILIYLDETYCNTTHFNTHSGHISTGNPIQNKSTSGGRSLIFIHAITKDVPLNNIDVIKGRPIDKIKRKDDNPHVDYLDIKTIKKSAAPLPLTSKLIWLSYSHTGDCHDNMNGLKRNTVSRRSSKTWKKRISQPLGGYY